MKDDNDITAWQTNTIAYLIVDLRKKIGEETDEVLLTHYKLQLEAARTELGKRNNAEIARREARTEN